MCDSDSDSDSGCIVTKTGMMVFTSKVYEYVRYSVLQSLSQSLSHREACLALWQNPKMCPVVELTHFQRFLFYD